MSQYRQCWLYTGLKLRLDGARWLASNIWFWLLVDDQALYLGQALDGFFLDSVNEIFACWNVLDETNDLAGGPDLLTDVSNACIATLPAPQPLTP